MIFLVTLAFVYIFTISFKTGLPGAALAQWGTGNHM